MAYINCATDIEPSIPASVSIKSSSSYSANNSTHTGSGWGTVEIPTLGFKFADITASSSNVGTGSNIDVSGVDNVIVSCSYNINSYHHMNPDGTWGNWYGGGSASYTVVLHN